MPLLPLQSAAPATAAPHTGGAPAASAAPKRPFGELLEEEAAGGPLGAPAPGVDAGAEAEAEAEADDADPTSGAPGVPTPLLPLLVAPPPVGAAPAADEPGATPGAGSVGAGPSPLPDAAGAAGAGPPTGPQAQPTQTTPPATPGPGGATAGPGPLEPGAPGEGREGRAAKGREGRPASAGEAPGAAPLASVRGDGRAASPPPAPVTPGEERAARGDPAQPPEVEARTGARRGVRGEESALGQAPPPVTGSTPPPPSLPAIDLTPVARAAAPRDLLPAAPAAPGTPAPLVDQVRFVLAPGVSEARIDLAPAELGAVSVRIVLRDGALSARLEAATPVGRLALEKHRAELEVALATDGVAARVEVVAPAERPPEVAPPAPRVESTLEAPPGRGDSPGGGARKDPHGDRPPPPPVDPTAPGGTRPRARRAPLHARLDTLA